MGAGTGPLDPGEEVARVWVAATAGRLWAATATEAVAGLPVGAALAVVGVWGEGPVHMRPVVRHNTGEADKQCLHPPYADCSHLYRTE